MKRATQVLYGLVAIGTIVLGGAAILAPGLVLPRHRRRSSRT